MYGYPDPPSSVENRISEERKRTSVLPREHLVYRALELTPFNNVRVVILSQDPYPSSSYANGLAFSVPPTIKNLPKSLINIYTELEKDTGTKKTNGDLTDWAEKGVLLLNTILTVKEGYPTSHSKYGWEAYTDSIIRHISINKDGVVFLLWGRQARNKRELIDTNRHKVLEASHPSPLSASKGFFGCRHFSATNQYLNDTIF